MWTERRQKADNWGILQSHLAIAYLKFRNALSFCQGYVERGTDTLDIVSWFLTDVHCGLCSWDLCPQERVDRNSSDEFSEEVHSRFQSGRMGPCALEIAIPSG